MYRRTTAFTTRRDLTIGGASVASGTTLTRAQVKSIPKLDALVANGSIEAVPETYGRRGVHGPKPAFVQPGLRPVTRVTATVDGTDPMQRNFVALPADAYVFDFDDGNNAVADADGTISHDYAAAGIYDVVATADYQVGTVQVTVIELEVTPTLLVAAFVATPAAAGPFTFDFGDESALVVDADGTVSHTYDEAGTYTASVTCAGTTQVATVEVVVAGA